MLHYPKPPEKGDAIEPMPYPTFSTCDPTGQSIGAEVKPKAAVTQAVIYARCSPRPQSTETSLAKQIDDCRRFAENKRLEVIGTYVDDKASGKSLRGRPGLQQAMDLAGQEKLAIVAYDLSRISRSLVDTCRIVEQMEEAGASLLTVSGPQVDTSNPFSSMMLKMAALIHEFFRAQQGRLTSEALQYRKSQGYLIGPTPYGWDKGPDGRAVPNPGKQRLIRWVLWRHHHGASQGWIANELLARGYTRLDEHKITRAWVQTIYENWAELFGVVRVELDWYDAYVNQLLLEGRCWSMEHWRRRPPIILHRSLVPDAQGEWPHQFARRECDLPALDNRGRICMPLTEIRRWTRKSLKIDSYSPGSKARRTAEGYFCLPESEDEIDPLLRTGFDYTPARYTTSR